MALVTEELMIPDIGVLFPKTRRWHDVKPCGTSAALRRHRRRGETLDAACLQADARRAVDYRARVKVNGGPLGGRWPRPGFLPARGSADCSPGV